MKYGNLLNISLIVLMVFLAVEPSGGQIPGERYFKDNKYVEYLPGNLPLLISVPHGGWDKPDNIPEREGRFAKNQDIYTLEIANRIIVKIHELTASYPYVVIDHLHRTRMDANRGLETAAKGNRDAEAVWYAYHNRIDSVRKEISGKYGAGLFIELHGHRHDIRRMEIGYLLGGEELRIDKELMDEGLLSEFSSIRNLYERVSGEMSFSDLILGENSMGSLLSKNGQASVPSSDIPYPNVGEAFFSGGYNTSRFGSRDGGGIDGIQIEIDLQTRINEEERLEAADDIAVSLLQFLAIHYFPEMSGFAAFGLKD